HCVFSLAARCSRSLPLAVTHSMEAARADSTTLLAVVHSWFAGHGAVPVAGIFCRTQRDRCFHGTDFSHHAAADDGTGAAVAWRAAYSICLAGLPVIVLRSGPAYQRRA